MSILSADGVNSGVDKAPAPIAAILDSPYTWVACRLLMTFMFWWEGLQFLLHFQAAAPAINVLGVRPVWLMPAVTVFVLIAGSALVVLNRFLWLGTGMLAAFTVLTIPLVHNFWAMTGDAAVAAWREAEEHVAVIGGLMALSIVSHYRKRLGA